MLILEKTYTDYAPDQPTKQTKTMKLQVKHDLSKRTNITNSSLRSVNVTNVVGAETYRGNYKCPLLKLTSILIVHIHFSFRKLLIV